LPLTNGEHLHAPAGKLKQEPGPRLHGRLGEEFHDLDDVRYLLRYLNISTVSEAMDVVTEYFDESQLLPKTKLALQEILGCD